MKFASALLLSVAPCTLASPGKSTIASAHSMESMEFLLKYLPVAVAEDNGKGNYGHGAVQGRTQAIPDTSYTAPNCQLYSKAGTLSSDSSSQSMTPSSTDQSTSVGNDCTYNSGETYGAADVMWKVFANNEVQCCNACISTKGCAAATFETSSNDHSGGMGPQEWEGFGIHLPDVQSAETTGGLAVGDLQKRYASRFADFSTFDAFMDYSVTFYTFDLQHYIDAFKADDVKYFLGQWTDSEQRTWYSVIFRVAMSTYVIELVSQNQPDGASSLPAMEQRMSDAHCNQFVSYTDTPAKYLEISSINRAASDMESIDEFMTLLTATSTHKIDGDVTRRCYTYLSSSDAVEAGQPMLDVDVCYTSRPSDTAKDATFSVKDHEANLWKVHAGTLGSDPSSKTDKYTDTHYALPMPSAGLSALASHFESNNPYPITEDTRLAYACEQNYIIDPTGFSIQPLGRASWPNCGWEMTV